VLSSTLRKPSPVRQPEEARGEDLHFYCVRKARVFYKFFGCAVLPLQVNYFVGHFMFGDMPHQDAMNSTRLFASSVMPEMEKASHNWLSS
jgi:hypothetical protein